MLREDEVVSVSIITLYELSYGLSTLTDSKDRAIFQTGIEFIKEYLEIYPLNVSEIEVFGMLKAHYKKSTGITKTAINHNAILVSHDMIFSKIIKLDPKLKYENWINL